MRFLGQHVCVPLREDPGSWVPDEIGPGRQAHVGGDGIRDQARRSDETERSSGGIRNTFVLFK
jgi:hypothetical protein